MRIRVSVDSQRLTLFDDAGVAIRRYPISTAAKGVGQIKGSECTPLGRHLVRARIGAGMPLNTVFVGRRPTGEILDEGLLRVAPERDWILTRILWLSGCEPGKNRLGEVDTMQRFIYIHGTPDDARLGQAVSHGCIRMSSRDITELFELLPAYSQVDIVATDRENI